ncbi:MAG: TlpA disulfide reductase family protein [candidate division WOR-3 bacterium]
MKKVSITIITTCLIFTLFCTKEKSGTSDIKGNDFTLKSLQGEEYTLSKLKGRVVIVDFWATWCPPCRREIPHLVALYEKHKDKGLLILGVSAEDKQTLATFARENNINYPILLGNNEVFQRFGVHSIPHTLFIDKKGNVRKTQIGYADELIPVFEALLDTLLNE